MAVGRPTIIDDKMLQKLEEGFMLGLTDRECCLYARYSRTNLI